MDLSELVSWKCKKQSTVSVSTCEAEYIAAVSCCSRILLRETAVEQAEKDNRTPAGEGGIEVDRYGKQEAIHVKVATVFRWCYVEVLVAENRKVRTKRGVAGAQGGSSEVACLDQRHRAMVNNWKKVVVTGVAVLHDGSQRDTGHDGSAMVAFGRLELLLRVEEYGIVLWGCSEATCYGGRRGEPRQ
ncbi:hypothetical protein L1987_85755 [Smallanthus sonchifolius]|uniref:Uncharacterized protein n=1 Tax=Smallanthus sonchifolius TaxID=185202 RepID=A0ACB8XXD8_9ASTR|nr:hypothetical protein L1987_85755 [Smallanthus sonchifolius]